MSNAYHAICGSTLSRRQMNTEICLRDTICQLHATNNVRTEANQNAMTKKVPLETCICVSLLVLSIYRHLILSRFCLIGYTMHTSHLTPHTYTFTLVSSGLTRNKNESLKQNNKTNPFQPILELVKCHSTFVSFTGSSFPILHDATLHSSDVLGNAFKAFCG